MMQLQKTRLGQGSINVYFVYYLLYHVLLCAFNFYLTCYVYSGLATINDTGMKSLSLKFNQTTHLCYSLV